MLTMVAVESGTSGQLQFPLGDSSAGYVVKDIQGLDPVKATLTSSSRAQTDGAELHNRKREPRNILMRIGFQPDYATMDVASLRSNLYRYLMPKMDVVFSLYDDDILFGTTVGVVESFDAPMFTADPEVNVSLMCYDPDFYAPDSVLVVGSSVSDMTSQSISYNGTSDTGIVFSLNFPADSGAVWINNTRPDGNTDSMEISGTFLANDTLNVNTNRGKKSVVINRAGVDIPILYWLERSSRWIVLQQGINLFRVYTPDPGASYSVEYTEKYGGF